MSGAEKNTRPGDEIAGLQPIRDDFSHCAPIEQDGPGQHALDPEIRTEVQTKAQAASQELAFRATLGEIVVAMAVMPRYRDQSIGDVRTLLIEPMQRHRVAVARPVTDGKTPGKIAGIAIWASVSEDVDAKIREQIKAGVFPVRLQAADWTSGDILWLIDVIAPDRSAATAVLASFKQIAQNNPVHVHPIVSHVVDPDVLEKMKMRPWPDHTPSTALH